MPTRTESPATVEVGSSECDFDLAEDHGRVRVNGTLPDTLVRGMSPRFRERLAQLRAVTLRDETPRLSDERRWYTEHTALLISTLKWALLGAAAGFCVGLGTRVFLWALERSGDWAVALTHGHVPVFVFLPIALPVCVWMIRTFSADARGHGTEAVIAAVTRGPVVWIGLLRRSNCARPL